MPKLWFEYRGLYTSAYGGGIEEKGGGMQQTSLMLVVFHKCNKSESLKNNYDEFKARQYYQ